MQQCLSAIAAATPPGSSVVELYAGCGVIGLSLAAAAAASKVVCVEVNPESSKAFEVTKAQLARSNKVGWFGDLYHNMSRQLDLCSTYISTAQALAALTRSGLQPGQCAEHPA